MILILRPEKDWVILLKNRSGSKTRSLKKLGLFSITSFIWFYLLTTENFKKSQENVIKEVNWIGVAILLFTPCSAYLVGVYKKKSMTVVVAAL